VIRERRNIYSSYRSFSRRRKKGKEKHMYGYLVSLYTKVHHTHKSPKPPLNLATSSDLNYNLTILNILSTPTLPFSTSNHHGPTFLSLPPLIFNTQIKTKLLTPIQSALHLRTCHHTSPRCPWQTTSTSSTLVSSSTIVFVGYCASPRGKPPSPFLSSETASASPTLFL
jgi:hypothetical protein